MKEKTQQFSGIFLAGETSEISERLLDQRRVDMEAVRRPTEKRPLEIRASGNAITIEGILDSSTIIHGGIEKALRTVSKHRDATVDAAAASILEGGADAWVRLVHEYLPKCRLHYLPSQLGMMLLYDDQYRKLHPSSVFDDELD